jgi:hypothetical protein
LSARDCAGAAPAKQATASMMFAKDLMSFIAPASFVG